MKRFNTISSLGSNLIDYSIPTVEYSESVVDRSGFVPQSELAKNIVGNITSTDLQNYDYPDGKDDGKPVPKARKKGIDLAEVDALVKDGIDKGVKAAREKEAYEADKARFEALQKAGQVTTNGENANG